MLRTRLLSVRVFEPAIESLFALDAVAYLHLHFAKPGCYSARSDRA